MAEDGESGGNKNCYGRNGRPSFICVSPDRISQVQNLLSHCRFTGTPDFFFFFLKVPVGTVVKEDGRTQVDLSEHGQVYLAVFGGSGGKGNRFFLSNENRAPMTSTSGTEGQERVLHLELRTMAHAGLVRVFFFFKYENACCSYFPKYVQTFDFLFNTFIPSGWFSKCRQILSLESHLQCQACRSCLPFHNAQPACRNCQVQGS